MQIALDRVHWFSHTQEKTVLSDLQVAYGFCGVSASLPKLHTVKQVHGHHLVEAGGDTHWDSLSRPSADAIYTINNESIGIKTADCLPILVAHRSSSFVMAIHAGWKGFAAGILHQGITYLVKELSFSFKDLYFLIGPAISQKRFEVGPEVIAAFFDESNIIDNQYKYLVVAPGKKDRCFLDLAKSAAICLISQGVFPENISVFATCTYDNPQMWHSFRRNGGKVCPSNYTWIGRTS